MQLLLVLVTALSKTLVERNLPRPWIASLSLALSISTGQNGLPALFHAAAEK
jgi:hypothetical protein